MRPGPSGQVLVVGEQGLSHPKIQMRMVLLDEGEDQEQLDLGRTSVLEEERRSPPR